MTSKSVRMLARWPAHILTVTATGPESRALLLKVEDPRWRGPPLRWACALDDPQYVRLVEAAGLPSAESDCLLKGYPVKVGLERRSGYDHVVELSPAPAGRSKNELHWVRLPEAGAS